MHPQRSARLGFVIAGALALGLAGVARGEPPLAGPQTEARFPPLVVPPGFKATLFACDPLVEYPSVIALGPRPRTLFVAHDFMTGLGVDIVRRDEIRLLEDSDGDGYADRSIVYAGEFNSIQGLAFRDGTVFAMHAPLLTALRDVDGDGVADERRDLLSGLGLTPEKNPTRLHCANGVTAGYDGWLYLALGDNGIDVARPERDRLVLNGGGILRCRPDGRDLHVFSTGLRNIYDVALDEQSNVFVRDNENDGGDYMIRVCHSFHGADHGYPYFYYERPDEALPPLADLGRGSSAGVVCYLEASFPTEFRGNLFACEWGRAVVRYPLASSGSGFGPTKEHDFAAGAATDPYGFKPTDLVVDRDGSLLVADWGDGQRPKRGRGRIYRIAFSETKAGPQRLSPAPNDLAGLVSRLDSPSHWQRVEAQAAIERQGSAALGAVRRAIHEKRLGSVGRRHAVWLLAALGGREAVAELFDIAGYDPDCALQAVRAIADAADPVFEERKLNAGRGDAAIAERLVALARRADPPPLREIVIALGRLRWSESPGWLRERLHDPDPALAHAAMQTLRRCDNWPAVLKLLDDPDDAPIRAIALRALANRATTEVVDGLIERLRRDDNPGHRREYAEALARVYKKPGPWAYWGYRPAPRPANTVEWERTAAIADALDRLLADSDCDVRASVLRRMQREQVPQRLDSLRRWLAEEHDAARADSLLEALSRHPFPEVRDALVAVIRGDEYAEPNRRRALASVVLGLGSEGRGELLALARQIEDGPVLADLLLELGQGTAGDGRELLLRKLASEHAGVRAAAVSSLAALRDVQAAGKILDLLSDGDVAVRRAAAAAVGKLAVKEAGGPLLVLARDADPPTRSASLDSLRLLGDSNAVPAAVAALDHFATQLAALDYLAAFGGPEQLEAVTAAALSSRSVEVLTSAVRALAGWEQKLGDSTRKPDLHAALAKIQGESGVLLCWRVSVPLSPTEAAKVRDAVYLPSPVSAPTREPAGATVLTSSGDESRIELVAAPESPEDAVRLAWSDLFIAEPVRAQFTASSNGPFELFLNGRSVYRREKPGRFQPDSDRFETELAGGINRVVVQIAGPREAAQFHVRFRRLSSSAEHERIAQFVLQNAGDVERGRTLFSNSEKSLCLKCHRLAGQGGSIGPDLTGIGSRFSRIHLIESILEPSRTIAPSYETITAILASGRVVTGVKVSESDTALVLGDDQGKTHEIAKPELEERVRQPRSTMPEGLEKRLTDRDLLDLVTFLAGQKK